MTLDKIYKSMHSPIRTQLFWIQMIDIPSFVSVHFVRHNVGVSHFVLSMRDDRSGVPNSETNRLTPINHSMLINAESLINMARKRLCSKASIETQNVMKAIKEKIGEVDKDLEKYLVPECFFRNGFCPELKSCGKNKLVLN